MYHFISTLTHVLFSGRRRGKVRGYSAKEQELLYVKAFLGYVS